MGRTSNGCKLYCDETELRACSESSVMAGSTTDVLEIIIPESQAGIRLDKVLAKLFPAYSRSQLQQWLKEGRIQVDDQLPLLRQAAQGGEIVRIQVPVSDPSEWQAQDLPLKVVHEDEHLVVLDKPTGLVVHPGAGNPDGTLANALLYRFPETTNLPRAGVVHRLDKDTSGLLVVARTAIARQQLIRDLEHHRVVRMYAAIVNGRILAGGPQRLELTIRLAVADLLAGPEWDGGA